MTYTYKALNLVMKDIVNLIKAIDENLKKIDFIRLRGAYTLKRHEDIYSPESDITISRELLNEFGKALCKNTDEKVIELLKLADDNDIDVTEELVGVLSENTNYLFNNYVESIILSNIVL